MLKSINKRTFKQLKKKKNFFLLGPIIQTKKIQTTNKQQHRPKNFSPKKKNKSSFNNECKKQSSEKQL